MMQAISGCFERISRHTSMPSPSGSRMSSTATSGLVAGMRPYASSAVPASPTTSMSASASSISRTPRRTISWSSRRNTRVVTGPVWSHPRSGAVRRPPSTRLQASAGDHLEGQLDVPILSEGCPARDGGRLEAGEVIDVRHGGGHAGDDDAPSAVRHRVHAVDLEGDDVAAGRGLELRSDTGAEDDAPVDVAVADRQDDREGGPGDADAAEGRAAQEPNALREVEDLQAVAVDLHDPEGRGFTSGWTVHPCSRGDRKVLP